MAIFGKVCQVINNHFSVIFGHIPSSNLPVDQNSSIPQKCFAIFAGFVAVFISTKFQQLWSRKMFISCSHLILSIWRTLTEPQWPIGNLGHKLKGKWMEEFDDHLPFPPGHNSFRFCPWILPLREGSRGHPVSIWKSLLNPIPNDGWWNGRPK
jgi:hypothetical protein